MSPREPLVSQSPSLPSRYDDVKGLNPNNWANIKDTYLLQPIYGGEGRVLILQDEYKSAMDCTACEGKGHTGKLCSECKGNGRYRGIKDHEDHCPTCNILRDKSQPSSMGAWIDLQGHEPCPTCNGTGSSSIIIPDESKTKTTMGNVLAVSEHGIRHVKVKDKVQYTNYTGIEYKFMGLTLVVAQEKDLLCIAKKIKLVAGQFEEAKVAEKENYGVPHE